MHTISVELASYSTHTHTNSFWACGSFEDYPSSGGFYLGSWGWVHHGLLFWEVSGTAKGWRVIAGYRADCSDCSMWSYYTLEPSGSLVLRFTSFKSLCGSLHIPHLRKWTMIVMGHRLRCETHVHWPWFCHWLTSAGFASPSLLGRHVRQHWNWEVSKINGCDPVWKCVKYEYI